MRSVSYAYLGGISAGAFAFPSGQCPANSSLGSHHGPLKSPQKGGATQALAQISVTYPYGSINFLELGACPIIQGKVWDGLWQWGGSHLFLRSSWDGQGKHIPVEAAGETACLSEVKQASARSRPGNTHNSSSTCACGLPWLVTAGDLTSH